MLKAEEREPMLARLGAIRVSESGKLEIGSWTDDDRKSFNGCIVEHVVDLQAAYATIKQRLRDLDLADVDYHYVYNQLLGRKAT